MNARHFLTSALLALALAGCQIEITPLDSGSSEGPIIDDPAPIPMPAPLPDPMPEPDPVPEPDLKPTPKPDPVPKPDPKPAPTPDPEPNPASGTTLYWSVPLERTNGDLITTTELGGYEIRYKKPDDPGYRHIVITDARVDQYSFSDIEQPERLIFQVAAFDLDGLYSDFVIARVD